MNDLKMPIGLSMDIPDDNSFVLKFKAWIPTTWHDDSIKRAMGRMKDKYTDVKSTYEFLVKPETKSLTITHKYSFHRNSLIRISLWRFRQELKDSVYFVNTA